MINEIILMNCEMIMITFNTNELCYNLYIDGILVDVKDKLIELFKINDK
jgi:hypothetical protein